VRSWLFRRDPDFRAKAGRVLDLYRELYYLLALAALVAAGGRAGDIFGRRRTWIIGTVLFAGFSALCGAADSEGWLIASRVGQGIGGALMMPATMALVVTAFPPEDRGKAIGILVGIASVFLSVGPSWGASSPRV
jgi:MFS family permease